MEMAVKILHRVIYMLKLLMLSYIITIIMIALLAFLVLKFDFNDKLVSGMIMGIYFVTNFLTTRIMLHLKSDKRLLRGMLLSSIYMGGIILLSVLMNNGKCSELSIFIAIGVSLLGSIVASITKV